MSSFYNGDHIDFSNSIFYGPVTGKQEVHHHYTAHKVDWPIRVGVIPEQAAHYQHRTIADHLSTALNDFGTVVLRQVLSGTGGVGKTQLAAHHARTLRDITAPDQRVDVLVWANASTRDQITYAYTQAARQLFSTIPEDPEQVAALFLTWLQDPNKHHNRRWLIVWDDLVDPAQVRDLWPPHDQPHGRVLVTTRRRDHSLTTQGRHLLDVDVYTPDEAHAFLIRALNEAGITHTTTERGSLACDLGYLPLALGQAVAYMAELQMGCTAYLELFHSRIRTLDEVFPNWENPVPLAATWELSLAQADAFTPRGVARPLMGLIALLDGTAIPESVLTAPPVLDYLAPHHTRDTVTIPTPPDRRTQGLLARLRHALSRPVVSSQAPPATTALTAHEIRTTLANLRRLNLITRTTVPSAGQGGEEPREVLVGAHQLIQRATREHTTTCPDRLGVRALADALVKVWPEVERDTSLTQQLRSNTAALRRHYSVEGRSSEEWLWEPKGHRVLFRSGHSLRAAGQVEEAVTYWQHMSEAARQHLGSEHPQTLTARSSRAHMLGEAGDTAGAAQAYEELLTDHLRVLGPNHPDTLITRNNLAGWRGEAGDLSGAVRAYDDLVTDCLRVLGSTHPWALAARANLAYHRGKAGDAVGAVQAYEELLTDHLSVLGPDHPDTLSTRNGLASMLGEAGDTVGATRIHEDLVADRLRIFGPDHPDTLMARAHFAHSLGKAGDAARAVQAYEELLTDRLRVLGPNHPDTLSTRNGLASMLGEAGDAARAAQAYEKLLTDRLRVLGPNHPDTLVTRINLAGWLGEAGDAARAAQAYEKLLTDCLRVLGPDHPHTLITKANLASVHGKAGNPLEAARVYEDVLTDCLRVLGPNHSKTLATRHNLAFWRDEAGDTSGAVQACTALLTDLLRFLEPDHPEVLVNRSNLATWTYRSGDTVRAVELLSALVSDQLRVLGPHHPHTKASKEVLRHWRNELSEARAEPGDL
ncbi:tetratricopeptide repeat protein [Nocardiopsis deserti]|uniref:tetratricopeptide repeat protein n=1 Tax=Nocardiopsis deserti TaxID=2605988 RepID=UPI00123A75CF|nr:tetratricopeptide repeat protein [Nocardiopsis deserti]